jgi:hypothetical protein
LSKFDKAAKQTTLCFRLAAISLEPWQGTLSNFDKEAKRTAKTHRFVEVLKD